MSEYQAINNLEHGGIVIQSPVGSAADELREDLAHPAEEDRGPTGTIFVAQTGVGRSGAFSGTLAPGSYSYTAQFSAHCGLPSTPLPESARTTLDYELVVGG